MIFEIEEITSEVSHGSSKKQITNLLSFQPDDINSFLIELEVKLAYKNHPDWDRERFYVTVASYLGIYEYSSKVKDTILCPKIILLHQYDGVEIVNYISKIVETSLNNSVEESILLLSNFFRSESINKIGLKSYMSRFKVLKK